MNASDFLKVLADKNALPMFAQLKWGFWMFNILHLSQLFVFLHDFVAALLYHLHV